MEPRTGVKTRRRRALACQPCRHKKLRCDRQQPCRNCIRAKDPNNTCVYADGAQPPSALVSTNGDEISDGGEFRRSGASGSTDIPNRGQGTIATPTSSGTPAVQSRQQEPGQKWHSATLGSVLVDTTPSESPVIRPSTDHNTSQKTQPALSTIVARLSDPIRAFMVRTRYVSPSSWLYSILLVPQVLAWMEPLRHGRGESVELVNACKALSKRLRDYQVLQWAYGEYGKFLPYRALSDVLVDNYLRTYETVYRVLHIPTFRAEYDQLWQRNDIHGSNSHTLNGFVVQVQLCCALGALIYDESFSLRAQAVQWTREAGAWIDTPAKTLLELPHIQTMCLHLLAYESLQGPWGDRVWIQSGTLVRAAMLVGLHRDPTKLPGVSRGHAEVRRRLWWTVLELTLGSCLDPGAAPLLSLDDCDSALPSNFDDTQLNPRPESSDGEAQSPQVPQGMDCYTDTSMQIVLGRTLPIRLAVARFATSLKPHDYQEVLELSERYEVACRELSASLRTMGPRLSGFQRQFCELAMARYTFTLHVPYMVVGFKNPAAYMLSRKACVDAAVSLMRSCFSSSSMEREPLLAAISRSMNDPNNGGGDRVDQWQRDDFVRLCITSSGPCRSAPFQALMIIAAELAALNDESRSSIRSSSDVRTLELLSLLRVAGDWTRRRIKAGHESNRDHVCIMLALTSIEVSMRGDEAAVDEAVRVSGKEACLEERAILEGLIPVGDAGWEGVPTDELSSPEYDLLAEDDMWLMQATDFVDFDFINS